MSTRLEVQKIIEDSSSPRMAAEKVCALFYDYIEILAKVMAAPKPDVPGSHVSEAGVKDDRQSDLPG